MPRVHDAGNRHASGCLAVFAALYCLTGGHADIRASDPRISDKNAVALSFLYDSRVRSSGSTSMTAAMR